MSNNVSQDFLATAENEGWIEEYCDKRDDGSAQCEVTVAKTLADDTDSPSTNDDIMLGDPPASPETQGKTDHDAGFDDQMETIVNDCLGQTRVLGFSRPNEHACHRAFEKQNKRIQTLESHIAQDSKQEPTDVETQDAEDEQIDEE